MRIEIQQFTGTAEMAKAVGLRPRAFQLALASGMITPDAELKSGGRRFALFHKERLEKLKTLAKKS